MISRGGARGNDEPTAVDKAKAAGLSLSTVNAPKAKSSDGREAVLLHAPAAAHIGFWNLSTNSSTALPLGVFSRASNRVFARSPMSAGF